MTAISWSRDNRLAFSFSFNPGVFIANIESDDFNVTHFYRGKYPSWSPDCRSLVFNLWQPLEIFDEHGNHQLSVDKSYGSSPDWTPDGNYIVYTGKQGKMNFPVETPSKVIKLFDVKTRTSRTLIKGEFPSWSPNGRKIAFVDGYLYIYELDTEKKEIVDLHGSQFTGERIIGSYTEVSWSPTEDKLLMVGFGYKTLFLIDLTEKNICSFANLKVLSANWSPDGQQIAFLGTERVSRDLVDEHGIPRYLNYDYDLYIMNADGTNVIRKSDLKIPG